MTQEEAIRHQLRNDAIMAAMSVNDHLGNWARRAIDIHLYPPTLVYYAARKARGSQSIVAYAQQVLDLQVDWVHGDLTRFYRRRAAVRGE